MKNFSVVIPTMFKSNILLESIEHLNANHLIQEIILINNTDNQYTNDYYKVKFIQPGKNIYVGPAWNLGVETSSQNYICLLNDDIVLNDKLLDYVSNLDFDNFGLLGLAENSIKESIEVDYQIDLSDSKTNSYGFGCCMFFDKKIYTPIPDTLKVFFTDNYLRSAILKFSNRAHKKIHCNVKGVMSSTSRNFSSLFADENKIYDKIVEEYNFTHQ